MRRLLFFHDVMAHRLSHASRIEFHRPYESGLAPVRTLYIDDVGLRRHPEGP